MAEGKKVTSSSTKNSGYMADESPIFSKGNYFLMAIGAAIIILGMVLMAGGKTDDPKVFNYQEVYSKMRITIAPILIIIGVLVKVYAIFRKSPASSTEQ